MPSETLKTTKTTEKLIKSKERVRDHAEVFTAEREVKAMCDLIPTIADRMKTVLEPACGTGNFLVEIVNRRLNAIKCAVLSHGEIQEAVEEVFANLYGMDIQDDNVLECRVRMLEVLVNNKHVPEEAKTESLMLCVSGILGKNIIQKDTLKWFEEMAKNKKR